MRGDGDVSGWTLVLETATERGSVALLDGVTIAGDASFEARDPLTGHRRDALVPAIAHCLERAALPAASLDRLVCDGGPGGFTSLRSAAAVAKGLCSALGCALYAVGSLELLARSVALADGRYIAALDAGRGECFASVVTVRRGETVVGPVRLVPEGALGRMDPAGPCRVVGPGRDVSAWPEARAAVAVLPTLLAAGPVLLDHWEPAYGRVAEAQARWEAAHGRPLEP